MLRKEQSTVLQNNEKDIIYVSDRVGLDLSSVLTAEGEEWQEGEVVRGVQYKTPEGTDRVACAALTIVCDGMYSNLRSKLSRPRIQHPSFFVGLLLRGCSLPHANYGHVVLARPSPILFYPISSTEVSLHFSKISQEL